MFESDEIQFINIFFKLSRKVFTLLFNELSKINLHPGQPPILLLLSKHDNLTQIDIANKVCVKPSTIAVMLKKMEKNGLIEKKIDKNDRRLFYISLTEKGRQIADKTHQIINQIETKITKQLTNEEKEEFKVILKKIISELENVNIESDKNKI